MILTSKQSRGAVHYAACPACHEVDGGFCPRRGVHVSMALLKHALPHNTRAVDGRVCASPGCNVGLATIQPGQSTRALAFAALLGAGFAAPLVLVVTGVQLVTPHRLIATATACTTTSCAISGAVFSAIYTVAFTNKLEHDLPALIAQAAASNGLPAASIPGLIEAPSTADAAALPHIEGVNPKIIAAASSALQHAYANSVRLVYIIAAPFALLAIVICWALGNVKPTMNYRTDAAIEDIYVVKDKTTTL